MLVYDDLIIWYHYDVLALDICVYYYSQFSVILWAVKTSRKTPKKKPVHAYADGIALGIGLRMCQMAGLCRRPCPRHRGSWADGLALGIRERWADGMALGVGWRWEPCGASTWRRYTDGQTLGIGWSLRRRPGPRHRWLRRLLAVRAHGGPHVVICRR